MLIDCISDLHGSFPKLHGGDLLIVAGDLTARGSREEYLYFGAWLCIQKYKKKILIAGNHDNDFVKDPIFANAPVGLEDTFKQIDSRIEYLCDSGTEFEGLKIWGSPWTKRFEGMNPHCMAFTVDTEEELAEKWKLIPEDIDILITHSPPYAILDSIQQKLYDEVSKRYISAFQRVGSSSLANRLEKFPRPRLVVFGHIHEHGGKVMVYGSTTKMVNASHVNERYEPVNKPVRVIL